MKSVMLKTQSVIYLPLCRGHLNSGIFLCAYDCGTKGLIASGHLINILVFQSCSVIISGCYTYMIFSKLQKFCFFLLLSFSLDRCCLYVWRPEYLCLFLQFAFVRMKTDSWQSVPNIILVVFCNGGSRRWFIYTFMCDLLFLFSVCICYFKWLECKEISWFMKHEMLKIF